MWKKEGFEVPTGKLSIHSKESIWFMEKILKAGSWQMKVIREGYKPQFSAQPPRHRERNNRSARNEMETVRSKVKEWEEAGYITRLAEPAWCTNPLSVVLKMEAETGKVKKRVVLDTSRHLNNYVVKQTVHLEDLPSTSAMVSKGDYMCVFDLENQFFHVQLAPEVKDYFGFAVPDEEGNESFFRFNIMVYGFAPAVAVVTRLIKPLQSTLHEAGIRTSIYVDDGQVLARSKDEARQDMVTVVTAFQLAGWNIQWAKTVQEPERSLKYLGFINDTEKMEYRASIEKQDVILSLTSEVLHQATTTGEVGARELSRLLGKLAALRVSHGRALHVATRKVQNRMALAVIERGWDSQVQLGAEEVGELAWIKGNLHSFNGKNIRNETQEEMVREVGRQVNRLKEKTEADIGKMQQDSWEVWEDNRLEKTCDFPGGSTELAVAEAIWEMKQLREVLMQLEDRGAEDDWRRLIWQTSSRNMYNFTNKGARQPEVRKLALQIKYRERQTKTEVKLVWVALCPVEIQTIDDRSRLSTSTDEWGLHRRELPQLYLRFQVQPTVDAFASSSNAVCPRFFSKVPQQGGQAVDFFAQQLQQDETYFCCPPLKEAGHMIRRLRRFAGIKALVVLPAWTGCPFWSLLRQDGRFIQEVQDWMIWEPACQDSGAGTSIFTSGSGIQMWAGIIHTGAKYESRRKNARREMQSQDKG
jgi:hypothetical protein